MRYVLAGWVLWMMVAEVFRWDVSMGPGLSVKNAILYLIAIVLMFRIAVVRNAKLDAGPIHACFAVLIVYAIATWLIAALIVEYPRYDLITSAIHLKGSLIDYFIFFLVFYHGTSTRRDAATVLTALLLAALFANAMTVADVTGFIDLGFQERESGRIEGALGEPNQYAAFIVLFLPGMVAAMMLARGLWRLFWLGAVMVSVVSLLMTVSRGAFLGLLVAGMWGAWLYRHRLSAGKVGAWVMAGAIVVTLAVILSQYGALLSERLFAQSGSIDMGEVSSGRDDIWMSALARMLESPLTFLTGFGWDVYWSMPFRYSPHNYYLNLWFNLGIPGVLCGVAALTSAVRRARRASEAADPITRRQLIGYVIGVLGVCVAVFFVDLYVPWLYFWAYAGVAMRLAVTVESEASEPVNAVRTSPAPVREARAALATDSHGWIARPQASGGLRSHGAHR